ncbi:hypothetical protein GX441_04595 [bacterium]|nr:hypothetical protein [bacterium]
MLKPAIPDILERVLTNGVPLVQSSREMIYSHIKEFGDHFSSIENSMLLIKAISTIHKHNNEDDITLLGLGTSLYNDCATAWLLMMQGFYQMSFMPQRHMLECSILFEFFSMERSAIQAWKKAIYSTRRGLLSDALRKVKDRLRIKEHPIEATHALLCDMNVHPTYRGIALMLGDPHGNLHLGPYVEQIPLQNGLTWLARISSYATKQLVKAYGEENLKNANEDFGIAYSKFNSWLSKWLKLYRDFPSFGALRNEGHDL